MTSTLLKLAIALCLLFAVMSHTHAAIARTAATAAIMASSGGGSGGGGGGGTCHPVLKGADGECVGTVLVQTYEATQAECMAACCADEQCAYFNVYGYPNSQPTLPAPQHNTAQHNTLHRQPVQR